jgi:hypothetical protein
MLHPQRMRGREAVEIRARQRSYDALMMAGGPYPASDRTRRGGGDSPLRLCWAFGVAERHGMPVRSERQQMDVVVDQARNESSASAVYLNVRSDPRTAGGGYPAIFDLDVTDRLAPQLHAPQT